MKLQEFLDQAQRLLCTTDDEEFKFETPGDMSGFLQGFRSLRRHPGDYRDGVWTMVRAEGRCPVKMKITGESTIVSRRSLLEIVNIVVDEANDRLLCECGPTAKLYERVCNDKPISSCPTGRGLWDDPKSAALARLDGLQEFAAATGDMHEAQRIDSAMARLINQL